MNGPGDKVVEFPKSQARFNEDLTDVLLDLALKRRGVQGVAVIVLYEDSSLAFGRHVSKGTNLFTFVGALESLKRAFLEDQ